MGTQHLDIQMKQSEQVYEEKVRVNIFRVFIQLCGKFPINCIVEFLWWLFEVRQL